MIITLDGPAASGKSSLARLLAQRMHGIHFNSGLVYRCIGFIAARDYGFLPETIHTIPASLVADILNRSVYAYTDYARIQYDGRDITAHLKAAQVDTLASCVSEQQGVRTLVNEYAQALAMHSSVLIADGRDCGTVMFPAAEYKFFITASPEVRALRWQKEQGKRGNIYSFDEALELVSERDYRDAHRAAAPLKPATDAVVIDTSSMSLDSVADQIAFIIHQ